MHWHYNYSEYIQMYNMQYFKDKKANAIKTKRVRSDFLGKSLQKKYSFYAIFEYYTFIENKEIEINKWIYTHNDQKIHIFTIFMQNSNHPDEIQIHITLWGILPLATKL